jgi:AcrR family transcriptional regulator
MGIAQRRERERDEVRRKILDAAQELFATEGYERVTMRRIAEAIEYSPTTIYLHFKDKDELVHSLCQEDFAKLLSELGRHAPPSDPLEAIRQMGRGYARFGIAYPNHYRFMFLTPFGPDHRPSETGQQAFEMVRALVGRAIASGALRTRDVDTLAQVLWASLHGAVSLLITYGADKFPCAPAAPDLIDQVIENGIRGALAQAPAVPSTAARRRASQNKKKAR